jgi:hypothetical protein
MKTRILIVAITTLLLGFISCNKNANEPTQSSVVASKTSKILKGEPVNFKFSQANERDSVQWSVVPYNNVKVNASGNTASILFDSAGSYIVNASYGQLNGSTNVSVQDSIYKPGVNGLPNYAPLTGDQIFISVLKNDSMGINGLAFHCITEKKYKCLNNNLLFDTNFSGQDLQVVFNSVYIPSSSFCATGEDYASCWTSWYPIAEGSHGFVVILDGKTYTGSFVKSGSTYTFTWPYTKGVTITPLVIN